MGDEVVEWRPRGFRAEEMEVRAMERIVYGYAVPWDEPAEVHEFGRTYIERFQRGAFAQVIRSGPASRVKAFREHRQAIGIAQRLEERERGLWAELKISRGQRGDEALELARDGALDGLSIFFQPVPGKDIGSELSGDVVRTEVRLREISLVPWGAFAGAMVAGVRSAGGPAPVLATPRLDAVRELVAGLRPPE
jgi:HK97 family phage prohead protease